ncbi:MAG: hypothetical protein VYC17_04415 [Nitrospinota bacterium]|nr:hypothetical protein [Nitrospinota bacterium]
MPKKWKSIPVVVITAKDLDSEDSLRLNGRVEKVIQKGVCSREDLLRLINEQVTLHLHSSNV